MQQGAGSLGRQRRAAVICLLAVALSACGTVLPPLDETDGAIPVEDADTDANGAGDDVTTPPGGDDANDTDVAIDGALDASIGDANTDVCRNCADVRPEPGASSDVSGDARSSDADARNVDADGASCPSPVNCALAACNGVSCGAHGQVCKAATCACPGGQAKESTCGDGADNDCDGLKDCADPDCARLQCGASTNQRCCGTTCADTELDPANCQGCGLACAAGQLCKRVVDASGTRGACTCAGTTSLCPHAPAQVCRIGNNDGQDNICACDVATTGNAGCAEGQVCVDVPAANFCRY